jgi:hypothetical protein
VDAQLPLLLQLLLPLPLPPPSRLRPTSAYAPRNLFNLRNLRMRSCR